LISERRAMPVVLAGGGNWAINGAPASSSERPSRHAGSSGKNRFT